MNYIIKEYNYLIDYNEKRRRKGHCGSCGKYIGSESNSWGCEKCMARHKKWREENRVRVNIQRRSKHKVGKLRKLVKYQKISHIPYKSALYDLITEIGTKGVSEIFEVSERTILSWTFDEIRTPKPKYCDKIVSYFKNRKIVVEI